MIFPRSFALAFALVSALITPALAHSLEEVGNDLHSREKYFQPVDSATSDFKLQDANGAAVRWSDFRGKVVVLNFIYTNCTDECPLHAERIAQIQAMVNQTPMKSVVAFATITTDPKRDNGKVLRDYGAAHGLDPVNWVFLTAAPDQPDDVTRNLAKAYGLEFTQTADGVEMHGVVTHVIDQDGRLRARFHGLDFEPTNLVIFVNALVNKAQAPHQHSEPGLWSKIMGLF